MECVQVALHRVLNTRVKPGRACSRWHRCGPHFCMLDSEGFVPKVYCVREYATRCVFVRFISRVCTAESSETP